MVAVASAAILALLRGGERLFLRGGRAPSTAGGLRERSASGLPQPAGYERGRFFNMAGLSCPGLDGHLRDGVVWQCDMYSEAWKSMVLEEAASVYGVHEPSAAQKAELMAAGTCIFQVGLDEVPGSDTRVRGMFPVVSDGVGRKFLERRRGEQSGGAVISITHPDVDLVAQAHIVSVDTRGSRGQGVLELQLAQADVSAVLKVDGVVRVDMQHSWVSATRQTEALDKFCAQAGAFPEPTRLQYLVCGKVGTTLERREVNKHVLPHHGKLETIHAALRGRERFNDSQKYAVEATMRNIVTLIQGPPGSGKTSVVSLIIALHSRTPGDAPGSPAVVHASGSPLLIDASGSPVLVAAPSNAGADNALQRHVLMPEASVGRYGNVETIDQGSMQYSLQRYSENKEGTAVNSKARKRRRKAMCQRVHQLSAVFGTLEMAAMLSHPDVLPLEVGLVVIDEAAQATEPLCIIPINYLAEQGHLALVGDHMQLPPTVLCEAVKDKGLERSMFERLFHAGGCHTIVLSEQYRMRQQLWSWPNDAFYMGGVATARMAERRDPVLGLPWDTPLAFVDVRGREERPRNGTSYRNEREAQLALELALRAITGGSVKAQEIAILTPYAAQNACITQIKARDARLSAVVVHDIDGFQGQERDFIVVSFVRSNSRCEAGFVDNSNRVNVILTRARRGLAVLGNEATLRSCTTSGLARFLAWTRDQNVAYVHRDGHYEVAKPGDYAAPPDSGHEGSGVHSKVAKQPREAIPTVWSFAAVCRRSPGVEAVVATMQEECVALSKSIPFLAALAKMISLPAHRDTMVASADLSPFEWDRKAWSREHFFASVGLALDPGNAVLAAALWALMAVAEASAVCRNRFLRVA